MQECISKKYGFSLVFSPAIELLITRRSLVQIQLPQPHEWLSVQKDIELFSLYTHKKLQKESLRNNEVSNSFDSSANSSADIFCALRRHPVGEKSARNIREVSDLIVGSGNISYQGELSE